MKMDPEHFMPILFGVLFGFIIFNIVVNFVLLFIKKRRLYKLLASYWPSVLFVFIMQAAFQKGDLKIALAYSTTFLSVTIISMIGFEAIGRRFPLKNYLIYYSVFYPITFFLSFKGYGFTAVAMPFAIALATPLFHTFIYIHFIDRKKTTNMQKVLGLVFLITGIHSINFALFRMDIGAQLWGWLLAYAIYDMLAILLPSIALEEANLSENSRLQQLVDDRTAKLNTSLIENEKLLKILMHDISNPLMAMKFHLSFLKPNLVVDESRLIKARKSQSVIEDVLTKVRDIYSHNWNKDKMELNPVKLEDCFNEVNFIFSQSLEAKNIQLVFKNHLEPGTKVLADKTSLTHSVLSNLVSNALKFSALNSEIAVIAREESGFIVLEVADQGPGIPEDIIQRIIYDKGSVASSTGTSGESGLGFGLTIAKSFVNSFGGQIEFEARQQLLFPNDHGTSVRITLEKAPMQLS